MTREEMILDRQPQVRALAHRVYLRCPGVLEYEDLVHEGQIGLIQAVDRFDPTLNDSLRGYCSRRIWGAMIDAIRSCVGRRKLNSPPPPTIVSLDDHEHYVPHPHTYMSTDWITISQLIHHSDLVDIEMQVVTAFLTGLNQAEIAQHMGYSPAYISLIFSHTIRTIQSHNRLHRLLTSNVKVSKRT